MNLYCQYHPIISLIHLLQAMHIVSSSTVYTPFRYDCCYYITQHLIVLVFPFPRLIPCAILETTTCIRSDLPMHYNTQTLDKQTLNTPHSSSTRWCMLLVLIVNFHYYLLMLSTGYYHSKGRAGSRIIGTWIGRRWYILWFHIIACRPIIANVRRY